MRIRIISFVAACLLAGTLFAQQPPPGQPSGDQEGPPIRVLVEEVSVPFVVTDSKNHLITDLNQTDFQVFEDKVPQTIAAFTRESNVPLRIGLLVDTSNSIRDRFQFEQRAAADFLRTLLRPGTDKAFLGAFDSMAELVQDYTDDLDKLESGIDALRPGGGTALYDAIFYASRDKLMQESARGSIRRTLVVLSDGEDNQSRFSRLQAMEMAQRAEVLIYTISTNISGIQMPGDKILKEFSQETGGRYFQPSSPEDLDAAFKEISTELRSQYGISYHPTTPRDGRYHDIEIVTQRKGLKVRSRHGYFATPGGSGPAGAPAGSSDPASPS